MECRTEITLEEILAEPMVQRLMMSDGISLQEARGLYEKVRRAKRRGKRLASRPSVPSGFGLRVQSSCAATAACL
jgi:hypothetical protein